MHKKLFAIFLGAILTWDLTGCGSETDLIDAVQSASTVEQETETTYSTVSAEDNANSTESKETAIPTQVSPTQSSDEKQKDISPKKEKEKETKGTKEAAEKKESNETIPQASTQEISTDKTEAERIPEQGEEPVSGKDSGQESLSHTICSWDKGMITATATCTNEGVITYSCTICGKTKTESISTISHDYVTESAAATCEAEGYTKSYCKNCGDIQSQTTLPKLAHVMEEVWFGSEPSCLSGGYKDMVCIACGWADNTAGTSVPPLGHEEDEGIVDSPENCMSLGVITYSCTRCGSVIRTDWTDYTGPCLDKDNDNYCDICGNNMN